MIKFFGLDRQYQNLKEEILDTTDQVLRTGRVLDGEYTRKFETAIGTRTQRTFAISVNSGSQALIFAQQYKQTLYAKEGITLIPSISFIATLNSVLMVGNKPVFCDTNEAGLIDLETMDMSLNDAGVDNIMYVNLFGNIIDYDRFRTQTEFFGSDIFVIEDAAQSFGGFYKGIPSGKLGSVSCLSFDPTKNLPNYGSGGMLLTDDPDMYKFLKNLRDNGKESHHEIIGTNSKMSELDSACMLIKLKYFDSWQQRRRQIAEYYNKELSHIVETPKTTEHVDHAWHKYVIKVFQRSTLQDYLTKKNIETKIHYDKPLFETGLGFNYLNSLKQLYRESSIFCMRCLSLPIYPELSDSEVEYIVDTIKSYNSSQ